VRRGSHALTGFGEVRSRQNLPSDGTNPQGALSALEPCSDFGALCFLSAALAGDARMVCHLHLWARVTSYHAWLSYMVVRSREQNSRKIRKQLDMLYIGRPI
jgi:hypothetical protein